MASLLLRVDGSDADVADLDAWLADVPELRGRVTAVHTPPPAGALGPVLDALQVAAVPGGAIAVLASAVVAWAQHRATDVTVRVQRGDDIVEVDAKRVRTMDADGIHALVDAVAKALERVEDADDATQG